MTVHVTENLSHVTTVDLPEQPRIVYHNTVTASNDKEGESSDSSDGGEGSAPASDSA